MAIMKPAKRLGSLSLHSAFCILRSSSDLERPAFSHFCILRSAFCVLLLTLTLTPATPARAEDRPAPDGFLLALPGFNFEFPRDHGSHDPYRTEWWYYTGHLRTASGRIYGFEVTFFRAGIQRPAATPVSRWQLRDLSPAHFAITDPGAGLFRYYEKLSRTSPFTASAAIDRLDVFNESWRVSTIAADTYRLRADAGRDAVDLTLRNRKPAAIHGENGVSAKASGEGYATHYYSLTRLEVSGTVLVDGKREKCTGSAWMDHEFGSSALREDQQGWDWFSVQLDNDTELMVYIIRKRDGTADTTSSGSLINADGSVIHLRAGQLHITPLATWHSEKSGATYPMGWRVEVPALALSLDLHEVLKNQELLTRASTRVTYWEGAVTASGSFGGTAVRGDGYVEMTGYDKAFGTPGR